MKRFSGECRQFLLSETSKVLFLPTARDMIVINGGWRRYRAVYFQFRSKLIAICLCEDSAPLLSPCPSPLALPRLTAVLQ